MEIKFMYITLPLIWYFELRYVHSAIFNTVCIAVTKPPKLLIDCLHLRFLGFLGFLGFLTTHIQDLFEHNSIQNDWMVLHEIYFSFQ